MSRRRFELDVSVTVDAASEVRVRQSSGLDPTSLSLVKDAEKSR